MKSHAGEQRKVKRSHLIYYLRVFDRESGNLLGHLVNITPDGIMLVGESPVEAGRQFQLRMQLKSIMGGKNHIDFEAESLWSNNDINPDFFDSGFKLLKIDSSDQVIIQELINDYGFDN